MAAAKKDKEQTLENVLWNCRVALRGVGSLDKNRDAVISLCFLKFAGDKFDKRRKEIIEQYGENPVFLENVNFYNADNVFYLPNFKYQVNDTLEEEWSSRWSFIVAHAGDENIAVKIDAALSKIEETNKSIY